MDVLLLASVITVPFALPGIWIMVGLLALGTWAGLQPWGWEFVAAAAIVATLSEVFEHLISWTGVIKAGGTKEEAFGAMLGSFLGAIGGSFLIPIPVFGGLAGLFAGAFIGAYVMGRRRASPERLTLSWKAAWARALSLAIKTGAAMAILLGTIAAQLMDVIVEWGP